MVELVKCAKLNGMKDLAVTNRNLAHLSRSHSIFSSSGQHISHFLQLLGDFCAVAEWTLEISSADSPRPE